MWTEPSGIPMNSGNKGYQSDYNVTDKLSDASRTNGFWHHPTTRAFVAMLVALTAFFYSLFSRNMTAEVKVRCRINGALRMLRPQGGNIEDLFKEVLKFDGRMCAWCEKETTDLLPLCGPLDPIISGERKVFDFMPEFKLPIVFGTVEKVINVKRDSTFARCLGVSEGTDLRVSNGEMNVDVKGSDMIFERIKALIGHGPISIIAGESKSVKTPPGPERHRKHLPKIEHVPNVPRHRPRYFTQILELDQKLIHCQKMK